MDRDKRRLSQRRWRLRTRLEPLFGVHDPDVLGMALQVEFSGKMTREEKLELLADHILSYERDGLHTYSVFINNQFLSPHQLRRRMDHEVFSKYKDFGDLMTGEARMDSGTFGRGHRKKTRIPRRRISREGA